MAIPTIKILFPVSSIVELETNLILVSHFSFLVSQFRSSLSLSRACHAFFGLLHPFHLP